MRPEHYFDHAATSFPKSAAVVDAVGDYLRHRAGNPGRGSHPLAVEAARTLMAVRLQAAAALGRGNPERVIFTQNGTDALNLTVFGLLAAGDHVVTTTVEHNAAARPLRRVAAERAVDVSWVPAAADGRVDPAALAAACRADTRLVLVTAGSNVLGARVDLAALRPALGPEVLLAVDGAQVAGALPLAMDALGVDYLAVPGHKGLGGPPGTGLLLLSDRAPLQPVREGGTGGDSRPPLTPAIFPDGFEAGTGNGPGVAGLGAALDELATVDLSAQFAHKHAVWEVLVEGLMGVEGLSIHSCTDPAWALPLVSFRAESLAPGELAHRLAATGGYAVRAGLHCAPDAHATAGTLDTGLVRASLGPAHTVDDAGAFVRAVADVVRRAA